jgi:hypothetical protein
MQLAVLVQLVEMQEHKGLLVWAALQLLEQLEAREELR